MPPQRRATVRAHTRQTAHGATRVRQHTRQTTGQIAAEAWNAYRRNRHYARKSKKNSRIRTATKWARKAGRYAGRKKYGRAAMAAAWAGGTMGAWALGRGAGAAGMFALGCFVAFAIATDKEGPVRGNNSNRRTTVANNDPLYPDDPEPKQKKAKPSRPTSTRS